MLDASGSYDEVGELNWQRTKWDLDGDGEFELIGSSKIRTITLEEPGSYSFRLQVEDICGHTGETSVAVEMFPLVPPVAILEASASQGSVPLQVSYDASKSNDIAGLDLQYWWKFDYLPGEEDSWPKHWIEGEAVSSHTFMTSGKRKIAVMIRDSRSLYSIATRDFDGTGAGWHVSHVTRAVPAVNSSVDLELVNGYPAIAYDDVREVDELHPHNGQIRYVSATDPIGLNWQDSMIIESDVLTGNLGNAPSMEIANGSPAIAWSRSTGAVAFCQALDQSGSVWSLPVQVHEGIQSNGRVSLAEISGKPAVCYYDVNDNLTYLRSEDSDGVVWLEPTLQLNTGDHISSFRPMLLDSLVGPLISFQQINWPVFEYRIIRGGDLEGQTWNNAQSVEQAQGSPPDSALVLREEIPLIAYYVGSGLEFRMASDESASSWSDAVFLPDIYPDPSSNRKNQLQIRVFQGKPLILDRQIVLRYADDSLGTTWSVHESIPGVETGLCFDLEIVDGCIAVSYQDGQKLSYAVKLP